MTESSAGPANAYVLVASGAVSGTVGGMVEVRAAHESGWALTGVARQAGGDLGVARGFVIVLSVCPFDANIGADSGMAADAIGGAIKVDGVLVEVGRGSRG